MAAHAFQVGQTVNYTPGKSAMPVGSREYKVIRLIPAEGGQNQYRIKGAAETFERMAKENELSRS